MDSQTPTNTPPFPNVLRKIAYALVVAAIAAYVLLLTQCTGAHAGGSDSSGYLNNARLISEGRVLEEQRAIPGLPPEMLSEFTYVPLGFRPMGNGSMVPTYPIGLPILFAGSSFLAGWTIGPYLTLILHAVAGLTLVFILARQIGLPVHFAGLATLMLGLSPLYLFSSCQALSDMPAMVWATASVVLVIAAQKRAGAAWPVATGAVFAMAVLIRPSNFLAIAPLAVALGLDWRRWALFALGGLPGAIVLGFYNWSAYGEVLASGYQGIPGLLQGEVVCKTVFHYVIWVPVLLSPVAALVLGLPWTPTGSVRNKVLLLAWILAICGFYAFYYFTHEVWWSLRFVLPAFPAIVIGAVLVLRHLAARITAGPPRWVLGVLLAAGVVVWLLPWAKSLYAFKIGREEAVYYEVVQRAREILPKDAVIVAMQGSGSLLFYSDFTFVRWDVMNATDAARLDAALAESGRPLYAILWEYEADQVAARLPGEWTRVEQVRHAWIWKRESPAR